MLPLVKSHLNSHGSSAKFRFTGHSLGGSLAMLIKLMLLMRGVAPTSALLPVITFGAPAVMCGGDYLLRKLGLSMDHVHGITMHRDIVPRAFSCNYPDNVTQILKAVNGNFRKHRCLVNQVTFCYLGRFNIKSGIKRFKAFLLQLFLSAFLKKLPQTQVVCGESENEVGGTSRDMLIAGNNGKGQCYNIVHRCF